jgi:autotransporter-associated beta strand protein
MSNHALSMKQRLSRGGSVALVTILTSTLVQTVQAANIWDGGSTGPGDSNWNTAANWDDDSVPTFPAALTFGISGRLTPTNDLTGMTVTGVTFAASAGAYTLRGNPITLEGNVAVLAGGSVTNDQTVDLPIALNKNAILTAAPVGGSTQWTVKGALVFNGVLGGAFGLTATGKNYVQLNGANTYAGDTIITGGDASFSIGNANALGSGKLIVGATRGESQMWIQSVGNLTVTNAVEIRTGRFISASYTIAGKAAGNLTLSGNILLNQNTGNDFWCQKDLTLSGTVSGGNLNGLRMASGKIILQGVNTFTNHLYSSYAQSIPTFNVNSDAALGHTNNGVNAYAANLVFQTAASTSITLAPSRVFYSYSGKTTTFDVFANSSLTVPGQMIGHAFAKTSPGSLLLTGVNTYGGGTTINGGILTAITNASLGATTGSLNFTGAGSFQPGATPFTLPVDRTVNLTNAGTYTAAFDVPTNFTLTVDGVVKGNVLTNSSLSKTGPGTLILTGGSGGAPLGGLNMLGGKLTIQSGVWSVAPAATADGTVFNVLGGATYEQTGGTNTLPIYACISQQNVGGAYTNLVSTGILSGGTLIGMELMVGRRNSAVMTISGNALLDLYSFKLGELPGYTTICNLDGGIVDCNYIATRDTNAIPQSASILNFNGGTLRAKNTAPTQNLIGGYGNGSTSFLTAINVKSGGAIIDSRSYSVVIPQVLNHDVELGATPDGGLAKRGTGTLSLTTNNTYTGVTSVEAGTLKLGVANALLPGGYVLVASNAVLDVNGKGLTLAGLGGSGLVTNNSLLAVTTGVAPGSTNAIGTLTLAATPAALGGVFLADVAADGRCDRLHVQGDLNLSGLALTVANPEALSKEQIYVIATCTGALTGPFSSAPLPPRWNMKYSAATGQVYLSFDSGTLILLQ